MLTKILEKVKIHLQIKKTERIFSVFFIFGRNSLKYEIATP